MIRVAVVGASKMAKRVFLPVLAAREDVDLAVLVNRNPERREIVNSKYRFTRAVESVSDIERGEVDCALLLTSEGYRREPLEVLLELGVDVLSEKPMANDLAEAEYFVGLAQKHERIFMIGFNRRFMPAYLKAKEFVADRPLMTARVWKHGAKLWEHTLHVLDVLRWFCGEPVDIQADGDFYEKTGKERTAAAIVRFDSGTIGLFDTSNNYGMRKDELEAHGENFSVRVYAPDTVMMYENKQELTYRHGKDVWYAEAEVHYGFTQETAHFLECVQSRAKPMCDCTDAIKSHRLAHDIVEAMRKRVKGREA